MLETHPPRVSQSIDIVGRYLAATQHDLHSTGWLLSFWYFRNRDINGLHPGCPLIADSGAFSAYTLGGTVAIEDYAAWLHKWTDRFRFAFNLDVLGDEVGSFDNWLLLREDGLDTVPVIHYGTRPEVVLPAYLEHGPTRIGLGGIAVKGDNGQRRAWVAYVFRWLRDNAPHLDVHGLGVHMASVTLGRFPWATTDSSSPGSAWRFGKCRLWDPDRRRWIVFEMDGRQAHKHGRVIRGYGFDPADVASSTAESREALVALLTRSECRAAIDDNIRRLPSKGSA